MSRLSKLNLDIGDGNGYKYSSQIPAGGHRAAEEKVEADSSGAHQAEDQDCF